MGKTDNKGFSLVEIIVVMAIMAVLTGTVAYGLSMSSNKKVEECARKIASELQSMRTLAFGKYEVIGKLYYDSGSDSYILSQTVKNSSADKDKKDDELNTTTTVVGSGTVEVIYIESGAGEVKLKDKGTDGITFKFSRSTGKLVEGPTEIKFTKSDKTKTMKIEIVELTGKITVSSE
jgi:prepilin-type N-terminal cleavage/methylation domain-containing protein